MSLMNFARGRAILGKKTPVHEYSLKFNSENNSRTDSIFSHVSDNRAKAYKSSSISDFCRKGSLETYLIRRQELTQLVTRNDFTDNNTLSGIGSDLSNSSLLFELNEKNRNSGLLTPEKKVLPVAAYREQILRAVQHSDVTIITAETGAGKSTKVPQYLLEAGNKVIVPQPRRIAASSLASFVADEQDTLLGQKVGFSTSMEYKVSRDSKLIFTTDGYQLLRELHYPSNPGSVIVLDEVHEFNTDMVALLAILHKRLEAGCSPKIVIMSATMDTESLSEYFGGNIPIIKIPGRTYDVQELEPGESIAADAARFAREGKNSLVFLPGKNEIIQMQTQLMQMGVNAEIIPLHSKLPKAAQDLAFQDYDRPKIILATNIAQTSLTIPGIHVVISSGYVRYITVENDIEALSIRLISQDEYVQQKGRAGRMQFGNFIYHGKKPFEDLLPESPPEIQNTKLDKLHLTLLAGKEKIEKLKFFHPVSDASIASSTRSLYGLNLIGPTGYITSKGVAVSRLPVEIHSALMLLKAKELSITDPEILPRVIDVVSIIEAEGVVLPDKKSSWQLLCNGEYSSDHIAQLKVFYAALDIPKADYPKHGIDQIGVQRALDMRNLLRRRMGLEEDYKYSGVIKNEHYQKIKESIWTGMIDSVFRYVDKSASGDRVFKHLGGGKHRKLSRDSVLTNNSGSLVVGKPFDIAVLKDHDEQKIVPLLLMATAIDSEWLLKNRPPQLKKEIDSVLQAHKDHETRKKNTSKIFTQPKRIGNSRHLG